MAASNPALPGGAILQRRVDVGEKATGSLGVAGVQELLESLPVGRGGLKVARAPSKSGVFGRQPAGGVDLARDLSN